MKYIMLIVSLVVASRTYTRIGDLTMASSRNIDSKTDYKLLRKYVTSKAKSRTGNALEAALDDAVKQVSGGEFLKNVRIYVR